MNVYILSYVAAMFKKHQLNWRGRMYFETSISKCSDNLVSKNDLI